MAAFMIFGKADQERPVVSNQFADERSAEEYIRAELEPEDKANGIYEPDFYTVSLRCDNCGAEMQFKDEFGHELKDGDYWTPNSWQVDGYVYECPECGERIKIYI